MLLLLLHHLHLYCIYVILFLQLPLRNQRGDLVSQHIKLVTDRNIVVIFVGKIIEQILLLCLLALVYGLWTVWVT